MNQPDADSRPEYEESEEELTRSLLEAMIQAESQARSSRPVQGLVVGWITAVGSDGSIRVSAPSLGEDPLSARALCPVGPEQIGAQCALMFEQGDVDRPIVMGLFQHAVLPITTTGSTATGQDARTFKISADREIALHCGKASLRLTQDGRIELRGTTLISHASGVNRIRGGAIKLN